jgi:hypothetical protein
MPVRYLGMASKRQRAPPNTESQLRGRSSFIHQANHKSSATSQLGIFGCPNRYSYEIFLSNFMASDWWNFSSSFFFVFFSFAHSNVDGFVNLSFINAG